VYGILAIAGGSVMALAIVRGQSVTGAAGFMVIFGAGMFMLTLLKSRKPQISVFEDFLELNQSRTKQLVRYRNITAVSQPDKNRLVVTLREDDRKKDAVIYLKELDPSDVEKLGEFLRQKRGKGH
jgi:hypothetical protein